MIIHSQRKDISFEVKSLKNKRLSIGFVPTMGALHPGHLSLIDRARKENDKVVVSIFVNPTQFNNSEDLINYPRDLNSDIKMLDRYNPDLVYTPSVEDIYPEGTQKSSVDIELGDLEKVMEGKHRPGHFKGVVQVVHELFSIVQPDRAYFGEKDFQQLAIIRYMTKQMGLNVKIVACPTIREEDGLAMSSRNTLLTPEERHEASKISRALFFIRDNWKNKSEKELIQKAEQLIESSGQMKVEYLSIADATTLQPVADWSSAPSLRCCIAVKVGKVRLIDNVGIETGVG